MTLIFIFCQSSHRPGEQNTSRNPLGFKPKIVHKVFLPLLLFPMPSHFCCHVSHTVQTQMTQLLTISFSQTYCLILPKLTTLPFALQSNFRISKSSFLHINCCILMSFLFYDFGSSVLPFFHHEEVLTRSAQLFNLLSSISHICYPSVGLMPFFQLTLPASPPLPLG